MRLTGKHETAAITEFNYGIANRGASIRVPHSFANKGYKGYPEDRRPNWRGHPYADHLAGPQDHRFGPTSGRVSAAALAVVIASHRAAPELCLP